MVIKILWLSRHKPLLRQIKELENLFGEVMLLRDVNPFTNAKDIFQRYRAGLSYARHLVVNITTLTYVCVAIVRHRSFMTLSAIRLATPYEMEKSLIVGTRSDHIVYSRQIWRLSGMSMG